MKQRYMTHNMKKTLMKMLTLTLLTILSLGTRAQETSYAIYVADKGYLKNVNNEHELDFNNFATNSKWTFTADGKLKCGTTYLKENGNALTTTTTEADATVWTLETDANNSAKHYFKSGGKYMRSGWKLSNEYTEGYTTDDRYVAYEVRGTNNVVWIADGTYVIMNRKIDYCRNDKNPPNLLYPSGSNIKLNHAESDAIAQWEITVDADGYYTFKNVSTGTYIECASGTSNCAITSTTATEDKFKFSLKLYGPSNKRTDWNSTFNGKDCTTYPSLYAPWFYSICPKTGNNDKTGLNAPSDDPANNVKSENTNNKSAGSQWNILPYKVEAIHPLTIAGQSTISVTGAYSLSATGTYSWKISNSENPNNANKPLSGEIDTGITYTWTITEGSTYASLSPESTADNVSTITLNVNSMPDAGTATVIIHCVANYNQEYEWSTDYTVHLVALIHITDLSQITVSYGAYVLDNDVNAGSVPVLESFEGSLDGGYYKITGLSAPLFTTLNGGTVKNVIFDEVNISGVDNAGAVAGVAKGNSYIYNCGVLGGSVIGTQNVGGLVGLIESGSNVRVVNCYSYADVSGGTTMAGIVGNNQGTVGQVRIAMCMMYGSITGAASPVYGGNHVSNNQNFTEYNYWRSRSGLTYTTYNDQLAIDKDEYLTRFPFYRHILNTHRNLASYYIFGDYTDEHISEVGHWVLKRGENAPAYPVIEKFVANTQKVIGVNTSDLQTTTTANRDYAGKMLTDRGSGGLLRVNYTLNDKSGYVDLPITDMDTLRNDYTYGKVVLPFASEFTGWTAPSDASTDYGYICTGWKITSVTKGGASVNSFSIPDNEPYNFADRDNPAKDIYDATNNPYIFAQGGNYIVPYGVTAINIEANFAKAYYLSDPAYDMSYSNSYGDATQICGSVPTTYNGKTVYTDLNTLVGKLTASTNPHSQAIVLVGNYHYNQNTIGGVRFQTGKAVSVMSIDKDCNQEPDYGWYSYHTTARSDIPPVRFDFVPNIGIGMATRVTNSKPNPSIGIWHGHGWFELTETALSYMSECEINSTSFNAVDNGHGNNRWIANSGYFEQIIRGYDGADDKLSYVQIGGNAFVNQYYPSAHITKNLATTLRPTLVTGGEVKECFMTGNHSTAVGENIYFWCAGGLIHKYLSAYSTKITSATTNVTAKVDHALIRRFFGGGTSTSATITGDIQVTMNNSRVDFYCGGPEFGDMSGSGNTRKKVITNATGTRFGEYYGAGFGGTSLTSRYITEKTDCNFESDLTFPLDFSNYKRLSTNSYNPSIGLGVDYSFDYILYAGGVGTGVARFYTKFATFSLATTGSVTNNLTDCIILHDFYGAGCQGKVDGTVTSTLSGCKVNGSVFGGGYKAVSNTVKVKPAATQPTYSTYKKEMGLFTDFGTVDAETWHWAEGTKDTIDEASQIIYTDINMSELGNVSGAITLTIGGDSEIGGDVYGGGNESKSLSNTTVTLSGNTHVTGNVFGGGNAASVGGSATVNIQQ